jgi:hypothetical protein
MIDDAIMIEEQNDLDWSRWKQISTVVEDLV